MIRPFLIGLTGAIGSGKSTAAAELARHGAEVIIGDDLGRLVLEQFPPLLEEIRNRFGAGVFNNDGSLHRRELGQRVFSNAEDAKWLTDLTFPEIHRLWRDAVQRSRCEAVIFDAAMIFEWKIENEFDFLILITASRDIAIQRLAAGGRLTQSEAAARMAVQVPDAEKATKADAVITNDGSVEELRRQIDRIWIQRIEPQILLRKKEQHESAD